MRITLDDLLAQRFCGIEAARDEERRNLTEVLPDPFVMDEPTAWFGDRVEAVYPLRWRNPAEDEDVRVWVFGANRPMNKTEQQHHFRRQIMAALVTGHHIASA